MNSNIFKRYKKSLDYTYCLGIYPVIELLKKRADSVIEVILSSMCCSKTGIDLIKRYCSNNCITVRTDDNLIKKISDKGNYYAIAVFKKNSEYSCDELFKCENHVVLVNPSNMGNLGTVIRTLHGFGIAKIAIIKPSVDINNPKVIRSSMGSIFGVKIYIFESIDEYLRLNQSNSEPYNLYPLMIDGENCLRDIHLKEPYALIFGNESSGLGNEYHNIGSSISISHSNEIDSLNLSIAVGITLYDTAVKRNRNVS